MRSGQGITPSIRFSFEAGVVPCGLLTPRCLNVPSSGRLGCHSNREAPVSTRLQSPRNHAFERQQGRCYYCDLPMWLDDQVVFARKHGMYTKNARQFRCTAEHLEARSGGGTINAVNIVAACFHCNTVRHRRRFPPTPEVWRSIQGRRAVRRWAANQITCRGNPGCYRFKAF